MILDPPPRNPRAIKNRLTLRPVWDFAVHVILGTLIFTIIAGGAVGLEMITARLEPLGIDRMIMYGLKVAEYAVFLTDLLLFLVFLTRTGVRASRSL